MDEKNHIGDRFETAITHSCPTNQRITARSIDGKNHIPIPESEVSWQIIDKNKEGHIYCMSIVQYEHINSKYIQCTSTELIDKMDPAYETMIVITDPEEFINRLISALENDDRIFYFKCQPVEYFSPENKLNFKITPFHKRDTYSFQREYRFFIEAEPNIPFSICIGNIEDIAELKERR